MPSLHPLTHLFGTLETPEVKKALLKAMGPNGGEPLTSATIPGVFKVIANNDPTVRGDDMTPAELRDLLRVRAEGDRALANEAAFRTFDNKLRKYTGLPKTELSTDDLGLDVRSGVAINKCELRSSVSGDVDGPTTASMRVDGEIHEVKLGRHQGHAAVAAALAKAVEAAGYRVDVHSTREKSTITVGPQKPLHLANISSDSAVRMRVTGNQVTVVSSGPDAQLAGGTIGISIGGKRYHQDTVAGQPVATSMARLRRQIEVAGYEVSVASLPTNTSSTELWSIRPVARQYLGDGAHVELAGKIRFAGEDRFLDLDKSIQVDNAVIRSVQLRMGSRIEGGHQRLSGRVQLHESAGQAPTASLSGFTNLSLGEPSYDGKVFTNRYGKECVALYVPHDPSGPREVPSRMFVLDQAHDVAFTGGNGGAPNPHNDFNGFYGFDGVRRIRGTSADAEREVVFRSVGGPEQLPYNRRGELLVELTGADAPTSIAGSRHFFDKRTESVYVFDIVSPSERQLLQVIRKD